MRLLFVAICGLLLTVSTLCQIQPRKIQIVHIDTEAFFDEKSGIRDLVSLVKPLDSEFEGVNNELKSLGKDYLELSDAIREINKAAERYPGVDVVGDDFDSKVNRLKQLECTIKSRQEEAHRRYRLRRKEVTKEVSPKIAEALKQFMTERGYVVVLDKKGDENAIIETAAEIPDVTSAFIKFFNERISPPQPK